MTFHAPQIIWLILVATKLVYFAYNHGKPRIDAEGNPLTYRFDSAVIVTALAFGLFYWGGFFG